MVGPALPQALRAIRYPLHDADWGYKNTNNDDPDTMATTCPEEHCATVITPEEKQKLKENSEVVDTLEYIFSLTCVVRPLFTAQAIFSIVVLYSGRKTGPPQKTPLHRKSLGASDGQCTEFGCTPAYSPEIATRSTILTSWMMTKLTSFSASVRLCLMNIRPTNSFNSTLSSDHSAES
jgi:hypothetical protein